MENSLREEVERAFAPEIRSGLLTICDTTYHSEAFGNASLVLQGSDFRLKLTVERGERYAFLAPTKTAGRWVWLQLAVLALYATTEAENSGRPADMHIDPQGAALLLRQHLPQITEAFGIEWETTSARLYKVEHAYREHMMRWLDSKEAANELKEQLRQAAEALKDPSDAFKAALKSLRGEK